MRITLLHKRSLAPLAVGLGVWFLWPAQALARALIRVIHGVPGVGTAAVDVDGQTLGSIGFGQYTHWHSIRSGSFTWKLAGGGKTLAQGTSTVGNGAYDIVVLEKGTKVVFGIYKAQAGEPGTALVRVIHGAPEFGSPELTIDGKEAVKSLSYLQATPYVKLPAGTHSLAAMRPGDSTPLVSVPDVHLSSGVSYSAVVLGTRGQRVRVVELVDRGGPLTRHAEPVALHSRAAGAGAGDVVVHPGDSLWAIARRLVGPSASNEAVEHKLVAIWDLNTAAIGTGDPNLIFPGTRLRLP
jgi:Domain of unknown function (DUF4397)/LysM domain